MTALRKELPPAPSRIRRLKIDDRGYPIPWFVGYIDGKPDFRVIEPGRIQAAVSQRRCWVCGEPIKVPNLAFVIGPMCAVNRVSSEPPSHAECAFWSARACPFLTRPNAKRREANMPEETSQAGIGIDRNPGVALVWITRKYRPFAVDNGVLFNIGEPHRVFWYAEGREATRAEVMHSIDTGLPLLKQMAAEDGPDAMRELDQYIARAMPLVPA